MTAKTSAELKAALNAACEAEMARIRSEQAIPPGVSIGLEMTAEIASIFDQYEAALLAEGKSSTLVEISEA